MGAVLNTAGRGDSTARGFESHHLRLHTAFIRLTYCFHT